MTFVKKHFGNILCAIVLVMVIFKQVPLWLHSNEQIGQNFVDLRALDLSGESVKIPKDKEKKVYIFWATWCGPCHLQLMQFDKAVKNKNLPSDSVVAISLDKSLEDLESFLIDKKYSFKVVIAPPEQSWTKLNVQATPSIAFVENKKIVNFFTGISPLSVYRARKFLN